MNNMTTNELGIGNGYVVGSAASLANRYSDYRDPYKDTILENKKIFYNEMADLLGFEDTEKKSVLKMLKSADEETLQLLKTLFKSKLNEYINK